MTDRVITEFAPAKVNLALHITGQRADGYHLLDSLVAFAGIGDQISVGPADKLSLQVSGNDIEDVPSDARNLVWKAAQFLDASGTAEIKLNKVLPSASGIGGGSSDAAAALRALSSLWGTTLPRPAETLELGADVPVCMAPKPQRMQGIGEILSPGPMLPQLHLVLANPRVGLSTPAVFGRMRQKTNAPLSPFDAHYDVQTFIDWLSAQRNDLQAPAVEALPVIAQVLDEIAQTEGCLLGRMSGSGATCFGLYANAMDAHQAEAALCKEHADWWVASGPVL